MEEIGQVPNYIFGKNIYFYHFYMVSLSWMYIKSYSFESLLIPNGPNVVSKSPGRKVKIFFQISLFYWIHLMILEKMTSCLWKLEPGFWIYGWIRLLGASGPNVVSRTQVPRSRHFLRFHDFIGFISWFLRKWGLVCENWSQGSELMAGYIFWAQVTPM